MGPQNILTQLRMLVIIPTLGFLGVDSPAARTLVLGTAAHESQGRYIQQLGGGPALGFWQIEPATEQDLLANFIPGSRFDLPLTRLRTTASFSQDGDLAGNLFYGCALCRLIYYRDPEPLPADLPGLAAYWKRVYNTPLGAGTVDEWLSDFATLIGDPPDV
jgi:hypothetical protein